MKRAANIQREVEQVGTIQDMTSIFEAIASIHIAQVKDKVMSSTAFFNELWDIYMQLRSGRGTFAETRKATITERPALVAITSDGGLIGDIDERIIDTMLTSNPYSQKSDIYLIGAHGSMLLSRRGKKAVKAFSLPDTDKDIDVSPIVHLLNQYQSVTVYYQKYVSLLRQEVATMDLFSAVAALGAQTESGKEKISVNEYIFEPSLKEILAYMESVMSEIALSQFILESKLAQYASRFNAMSRAKNKAHDMEKGLRLTLSRSKRAQSDERIKEVLSSMKIMARHQRG